MYLSKLSKNECIKWYIQDPFWNHVSEAWYHIWFVINEIKPRNTRMNIFGLTEITMNMIFVSKKELQMQKRSW